MPLDHAVVNFSLASTARRRSQASSKPARWRFVESNSEETGGPNRTHRQIETPSATIPAAVQLARLRVKPKIPLGNSFQIRKNTGAPQTLRIDYRLLVPFKRRPRVGVPFLQQDSKDGLVFRRKADRSALRFVGPCRNRGISGGSDKTRDVRNQAFPGSEPRGREAWKVDLVLLDRGEIE